MAWQTKEAAGAPLAQWAVARLGYAPASGARDPFHSQPLRFALIIRSRSYARAGLIGNPSDGYHGKTISFIIRNFEAEVVLYESPELEILPSGRDHSVFAGMRQLAEDVGLFGYYGGIRLLKATVKRFYDHCAENGIELDEKNFTIRYTSNIPEHVGMAGSSAIFRSSPA